MGVCECLSNNYGQLTSPSIKMCLENPFLLSVLSLLPLP